MYTKSGGLGPQAAIQSAMSALAEGRSADAEAAYLALAAASPGSGDAEMLGGIVAARTGRREEAIERFRAALAKDSRLAPAHNWLAVLLVEDPERAAEALGHARIAQAARPDDPQVLLNLGRCLLAVGAAGEAISALERAVTRSPGDALLYRLLAQGYEATGREIEALKALQRAAKRSPEFETFLRWGNLLVKLGRPAKAVEVYEQALRLQPSSTTAHLAIGRAYADLSRDDNAFRHLELAAANDPTLSDIPLRRAHLLQGQGRFAEADAEFERALAIEPGLGVAYHGLVAAKRIGRDSDFPQRIRSALALPDLSGLDEANLHYALGKVWDDQGEFGNAMAEFDQANAIEFDRRVRSHAQNKAAVASEIDIRTYTFDSAFYDGLTGRSESDRPIFIVGMPRSGTTLVEQILACHPDVAAGGELSFWTQAESRLVDFRLGILDVPGIAVASQQYLDLTGEIAQGKPHVTDKNPANCLALGLIHAALPNARIIRVGRDAADTALSIYSTPWHTPPDFACDKDGIAFFFERYLRLMAHWRATLPTDRFIEIGYEQLVMDGEPVVRRLLEFCGLTWHPACAHPERHTRSVRTPSFWQVRQPMYSSSIGRWKKYRPHLGPFERLIGLDNVASC